MIAVGVALPLAAALLGFLLPYRARRAAARLAVGGTAGAAAVFLLLAPRPTTLRLPSVDVGGLVLQPSLRVTLGAAVVAIMVTIVALAVQVYSIGYLADDDRYVPYAAQVSLFVAAMLLVVLAGDLVTVVVGWEVMGLCSYLLIGHDRSNPAAPAAAMKALLVTRVGDVGFLLGVIILAVGADSFAIDAVLTGVTSGAYSETTLTIAALLILAGIVGKSAQFPLHGWLPDAMAGPTPISALIHAATMVAAGIYLLDVLNPVFAASDVATTTVSTVGAITVLLGGAAALATDDLKRLLAYSTISQLGMMVAVAGLGATEVALFQLITHGVAKALLFLCAGAVLHAVGTSALAQLGGLSQRMPVTFVATTIGLASLAGVPPLAGFWSKDALVHAAGESWAVAAVLWLAAALTAGYATRLWLVVFWGPRGSAARTVQVAEVGSVLLMPIIALAAAAVLVGLGALAAVGRYGGGPEPELAAAASGVAVAAALATWGLWRWRGRHDPAALLGPVRPALANTFYVDSALRALFVMPLQAVARGARWVDERIVDGTVIGLAAGALRGGALVQHQYRGATRYVAWALVGAAVLSAAGYLAWEAAL